MNAWLALPFQHEPRQRGHTVFLDEQMVPYPDEEQWTALASIPRIDPQTVQLIAREATRQGCVIGVRMAEAPEDDDHEPWARPPSGRPLTISGSWVTRPRGHSTAR